MDCSVVKEWWQQRGFRAITWPSHLEYFREERGKMVGRAGRIRTPNLVLGHVVRSMEGKKASGQNTRYTGGQCSGRRQIATSNRRRGILSDIKLIQGFTNYEEGSILKFSLDFIFYFQTSVFFICSIFVPYVFALVFLFRWNEMFLSQFLIVFAQKDVSSWSQNYPVIFQILLCLILTAKTKSLIHWKSSKGTFWWNPKEKHYRL